VDITTPSQAHLGRAIRRLREQRGLSIEALAAAADMHPTYLSGIERGHRNPTWTKLSGLAKGLNTTIAAIVREAETETSNPKDHRPHHQPKHPAKTSSDT
jgi:transcriptional regulator with XRE-family HTH domain